MLSILTEPRFPKFAIGIEHDDIVALSLRRVRAGRFEIDRAAAVELPRGLLTPGFAEKNISSEAEFRTIVEDAVVSAGLANQRNWSIALPGGTARAAILSIESDTAGANLDEVLDWKAEQTFGVPAGELRISRRKIAASDDGRPRWFATAIKLSVIDEYESVFESLGWKAGLIVPRSLGETRWLMSGRAADALLISEQVGGFTAVLIRNNEPAVVRSVTCLPAEMDDEIFRLLMFYRDRFAASDERYLDRLLVVGETIGEARVREICFEALGKIIGTMNADDIGLSIPDNSLPLGALAAPAGLASYGFR